MIRNIGYGLRNLWRWRKIIWNDRDWDWAYLYQIMEFKLLRMAALHRKHGLAENAEEFAEEMERAAGLLRRICDDDYVMDSSYFDNLNADLAEFCELFREKSLGWWD